LTEWTHGVKRVCYTFGMKFTAWPRRAGSHFQTARPWFHPSRVRAVAARPRSTGPLLIDGPLAPNGPTAALSARSAAGEPHVDLDRPVTAPTAAPPHRARRRRRTPPGGIRR